MISHTTERFRKLLKKLPKEIRGQAKDAYTQFKKNPYHSGLHFKQVHAALPVYSARISLDYRAVGVLKNNEIVWFWVGSHSDYNKIVKQLRRS